MIPINYFNVSLFIGSLIALGSGIFAYFRNKERLANRAWLRLNIAVAIWSIGYFLMITTSDKTVAWYSNWILHAAAIFIPVLYMHFVLALINKSKEYKRALYLSYFLAFIFFVLNPTRFFIQDVKPKFIFDYVCDAGPLYIYFTLYFFGWAVLANYLLYKDIRTKTGAMALQLKYVLFSSTVGFLGGGSVFLLTFNILIPPYPVILFALYPIVITYAIVRYRFMDVRAVAFRSFIFGLALVAITIIYVVFSSIVSVFFSNFLGDKSNLFTGSVLGVLVVLGYAPIHRALEQITSNFLYRKSYDADKLLSRINDSTSSILNINQLLAEVSKTLMEAFHFEKFGIAFLVEKEKIFKILFKEGFEPGVAEALAGYKNVTNILLKELELNKGVLVVDEMKSRYENGEFQPVSVDLLYKLSENDIAIVAPLYVKKILIGAMVIGTKKSGELYNEQDINILNIITGQMAVATENSQLYDQLKDFNINLQQKVDDQTKEIMGAYEAEKRAKERIDEARVKDEALLSSIGDGVIAIDKSGKVTFINSVAEEMLVLKNEQAINKSFEEILKIENEKGEAIKKEASPLYQALSSGRKIVTGATGGSDSAESVSSTVSPAAAYYFARGDKTKFPAAVTVAPVVLNGKIIGAVAVFRDVTIERQIDRSKSEFVSLASHQLRTPLTAIKWYSDVLFKEKLSAKQKKCLNGIYDGNERMIKLIDVMLNVSRLEAGKIKINPSPTNVKKILEDIINEQKFTVKTKKQKFIFECPDDLPEISIDQNLVRLIFQNLISNAIKYTPDEGEILCKVEKKNNLFSFEVKDTGIGIPQNQQKRVFEKLFRADNAFSHTAEGNGLGLYAAKMTAESLGGKIWFESKAGKGTTFFVDLPVSPAAK